MARKAEDGLSYFPLNSDIVHNPKIRLVVAEFGPKAWAVLLPLYCKIYREKGYWIDWYDEDSKLLFANDECKLEIPFVNEVAAGCLRRGLFDRTVFEAFGVLTSDRIQCNYLEGKKRNKKIVLIEEFLIKSKDVDISGDNVNIISLDVNIIKKNVSIGTQNRRRINEEVKGEKHSPNGDEGTGVPSAKKDDSYKDVVKDKTGIYNYIRQYKPTDVKPYVDFWNLFATEKKFPLVSKINDSRKRKFAIRIKDPAFDFPAILKRAGKSEFIAQSNWFTFDWIIENETNYLKVLEGKFDKKESKEDESISTTSATEEKGRKILASVE